MTGYKILMKQPVRLTPELIGRAGEEKGVQIS